MMIKKFRAKQERGRSISAAYLSVDAPAARKIIMPIRRHNKLLGPFSGETGSSKLDEVCSTGERAIDFDFKKIHKGKRRHRLCWRSKGIRQIGEILL